VRQPAQEPQPPLYASGLALAGGVIATLALPPLGLWPLAFVGLALIDQSIADQGHLRRWGYGWIAGIGLLGPGLYWMNEFSAPGWLAASVASAAIFGLGPLLAGSTAPGRWVALPGGLVLVDLIRSTWPFDGVPVATIAETQIGGPLAPVVRLGGPLLLGALVVAGGIALSAAYTRSWRAAAAAAGLVILLGAAGWTTSNGSDSGQQLRVALVQGGGERGTRAINTPDEQAFGAQLVASDLVQPPVDLVLWPEDVVDVDGDVAATREGNLVGDLASRLRATVIAGVVEGEEDVFRNWAVAWGPNGEIADRYEKNVRVPFGEWIPFRSIVEEVADVSAVPRDAAVGHGPGFVRTPAGDLGVVISWEVFFARRARAAVNAGGRVLLVPTNASSFATDQMPEIELAVARLRALETGRWVLQAAPTGYSAVVDPDGRVHQHTDLGAREVLHASVPLRTGRTLYGRWGDGPLIVIALLALATPLIPRASASLGRR